MTPLREVPENSHDRRELREIVRTYGVPSTVLTVARIARDISETIDADHALAWERHSISAEVAARAMQERDDKASH